MSRTDATSVSGGVKHLAFGGRGNSTAPHRFPAGLAAAECFCQLFQDPVSPSRMQFRKLHALLL